jgi:glycosyltransferase involved in cell wall biosynthesis
MVMPKHVLFIVENNPATLDTRVWAEALAAREFGYDVSVISPEARRNGQIRKRIDNIDVYEYRRPLEGHGIPGLLIEYANAFFWEIVLGFRVFLTKRFHIIHAANPPDHLFLIGTLFKLFGVRFIFDHHDIAPENFVAKFGRRGFFYSTLLAMERLSFKTADIVISTNESYRKIACTRGGRNGHDVFVVRNGPDLTRIPPVDPNPALRGGFKYMIGYVGTMGQQEGIENLLRTVEYLVKVKHRNDIRFVIVGQGPHLPALVQLSKEMELENYVWFTGYIPYRDLYEILATVDICVNPEFGNEFTDKSTMIKIMEYMAFGKPIVQFHTTEGEISAGDAAVYVSQNSEKQFAAAIVSLLENPDACRLMGSKGRQRIEDKLGWHKQKAILKDVYEAALSK